MGCFLSRSGAAASAEPTSAATTAAPSLQSALTYGRGDEVERALAAGGDANAEVFGSSPLVFVLRRSKDKMGDYDKKGRGVKVATALLAARAEVNAKGAGGMQETALHLACFNGQAEFVELLLSKGADPNSTNNQGWTALHTAAVQGSERIVSLLLHGPIAPDLSAKNVMLETAADAASSEAVRGLIEAAAR